MKHGAAARLWMLLVNKIPPVHKLRLVLRRVQVPSAEATSEP